MESFRSLKAAADLYPLDQRAQIGLGKKLMSQKRPRAALRRFDRALKAIGDRDVHGGWIPLKSLTWDARVSAGETEQEAEREAERRAISETSTRE